MEAPAWGITVARLWWSATAAALEGGRYARGLRARDCRLRFLRFARNAAARRSSRAVRAARLARARGASPAPSLRRSPSTVASMPLPPLPSSGNPAPALDLGEGGVAWCAAAPARGWRRAAARPHSSGVEHSLGNAGQARLFTA